MTVRLEGVVKFGERIGTFSVCQTEIPNLRHLVLIWKAWKYLQESLRSADTFLQDKPLGFYQLFTILEVPELIGEEWSRINHHLFPSKIFRSEILPLFGIIMRFLFDNFSFWCDFSEYANKPALFLAIREYLVAHDDG